MGRFSSSLFAALSLVGCARAATAQGILIGGSTLNGHLDQTVAQEIVPGFFLAKPATWINEGFRVITGPYEDELQSEPWAGPSPTPVTTGGNGLPHPSGCGGLDCGVFFKPFSGNVANGAATGHLYQDHPTSFYTSYVFTGWAGGEPNLMVAGAEIAIEFLDAGGVVIPQSGHVVNLLPTLTVDNGQPFDYKQYRATAFAPPNAVEVRARVSMLGGIPNPAGGGQAFVVDDFTLTESLYSDDFEGGDESGWSTTFPP